MNERTLEPLLYNHVVLAQSSLAESDWCNKDEANTWIDNQGYSKGTVHWLALAKLEGF